MKDAGISIEDIGKLRRTHYTIDVIEEEEGKEVVLMGWVHEIRDLGGIKFLLLRDREGIIQITFPKKKVPGNIFKIASKLTKESIIAVKGKIIRNKQAPNSVEILPSDLKVLSLADALLPLDVTEKVKADLDTRLDARVLDLRKPKIQAIFKIRMTILNAFREYLKNQGFIEVNTPTIVAAATEGGAELFPVAYFEREAFLRQSPQLYKQMLMATGFDRVFEICPVFRAEKHNTVRHLNEITQMDIEMAFATHEDAMRMLENVVRYMIEKVAKENKRELELLNKKIDVPETPFKRLTYDEVLEIAKKYNLAFEWGEDVPTQVMKLLGKLYKDPIFIVDWPTEARAFYAMPHEDDEKYCYAFDLAYRGIEISSGTCRIHQYDLLVKQLKARGLSVESFKAYLDAFRYGMPPHAGWSIGAERFLMALLDLDNIREATLFPRDRKRLLP